MKAQVIGAGELYSEPQMVVEITDHQKEVEAVREFLMLCQGRGGAEVSQKWEDTISCLVIEPRPIKEDEK